MQVPRPVLWWLYAVVTLIFLMVVVGGVTRLTGSGLSMVEWRPLMGTLPPLSQAEWQRVYALYQQSPQYEHINQGMTLAQFRSIFFWEYTHRLLGRVIGLVAIGGWIWFWVRKQLPRPVAWRSGIGIVMGGLQGVLGWFMVQSGLASEPSVSHFRLAAHLLLALFVAMWFVWLIADIKGVDHATIIPRVRALCYAAVAGLVFQTMYGAFMAGTRAGFLYQTYPDMNGAYSPTQFVGDTLFSSLVSFPPMIHWIHRWFAVVVVAVAMFLWVQCKRSGAPRSLTVPAAIVAHGSLLQTVIGVLTVITGVHLHVAVLHQAFAFVLLVGGTLVLRAART